VTEAIFAVLYVSFMGLTRCYKTKVSFTFISYTERQFFGIGLSVSIMYYNRPTVLSLTTLT